MSANQSVQLKVPQTEAVPLSYQVPGAQLIELQAVYAEFDGSSASGSYLPAVEILSQDGLRMMLCPVSTSVAAGSDADATFAPFLRATGTGGGGRGPVVIYHTELAAPAATIDTGAGAIPATFTNLMVLGKLRTTAAVVNDIGTVTFNGDTAAVYDRVAVTWSGTSVAFNATYGGSNILMDVLGGSADAHRFETFQITFVDYADTTAWKQSQSGQSEIGGAANNLVRVSLLVAWTYRSLNAINQLTFAPTVSGSKWAAGCSLTIYGLS